MKEKGCGLARSYQGLSRLQDYVSREHRTGTYIGVQSKVPTFDDEEKFLRTREKRKGEGKERDEAATEGGKKGGRREGRRERRRAIEERRGNTWRCAGNQSSRREERGRGRWNGVCRVWETGGTEWLTACPVEAVMMNDEEAWDDVKGCWTERKFGRQRLEEVC